LAISSCDGEISLDRKPAFGLAVAVVITPTESITGASLPFFRAGEVSIPASAEPLLRCFAGPISLVSFFSLEDLEVRGVAVDSPVVLISGTLVLASSAIFVFFEALLDCMTLIKTQLARLVSIIRSKCSHFRRSPPVVSRLRLI